MPKTRYNHRMGVLMKKMIVGAGLGLVLLFSGCRTDRGMQTQPTQPPPTPKEAQAGEIYDAQQNIRDCAGVFSHKSVVSARTRDDFVADLSENCNETDLSSILAYWSCFRDRLQCPVKSSGAYVHVGDQCLPLPSVSASCCKVYKVDWSNALGYRFSAC